MRHGGSFARIVKPSGWAHATGITLTPRRCLLRSCALRFPTSRQRRFLQSASSPGEDLSPRKPVKDHSWVFANADERIETINGKALKGIDEYVTHLSGTKLLCSWNVGSGNDRTIWVPGDAPRVRDMKLPADLMPEAVKDTPNSDWTLGNPQASFEPFFASLAAMNPLSNFDSTDVIAHSGTLLLLLGVARGTITQLGASNTAVAFHITLIKNTLIIKRMQNPTKGHTLGRGSTPTMTGSFMNRITEMKASEESINPDHSQAVRYDLAHLRCVVITPVDAATGNTSLGPITIAENNVETRQTSESVKVIKGGRGVPPAAVTKVMTGVMGFEPNMRRLNYRGQLKIKPSGQAKIWFERPKVILQGHLEPASLGASVDSSRLARVSVRETEPLLEQVDNACQLELRRLVTLLERLRSTTRRVGGSSILTCLPPEKNESGGVKAPARFELYKCGPGAERLVLDWHVERFWSKI